MILDNYIYIHITNTTTNLRDVLRVARQVPQLLQAHVGGLGAFSGGGQAGADGGRGVLDGRLCFL